MVETKKVLCAFDPKRPKKVSREFLLPVKNELGEVEFFSAKSGKVSEYGIVVLTSQAVNENDLFAKLVESGVKIPDVNDTLETLCSFIEAIKKVKIGNVVNVDKSSNDFALVVASNTPAGFGK